MQDRIMKVYDDKGNEKQNAYSFHYITWKI